MAASTTDDLINLHKIIVRVINGAHDRIGTLVEEDYRDYLTGSTKRLQRERVVNWLQQSKDAITSDNKFDPTTLALIVQEIQNNQSRSIDEVNELRSYLDNEIKEEVSHSVPFIIQQSRMTLEESQATWLSPQKAFQWSALKTFNEGLKYFSEKKLSAAQAQRFFEEAAELYQEANDQVNASIAQANIAAIFNEEGRKHLENGHLFDAQQCFEKALSLAQKENKKEFIYIARKNLALVFKKQGFAHVKFKQEELPIAQRCFEKALMLYEEIKEEDQAADTRKKLVYSFIEDGCKHVAFDRLSDAQRCFEKALLWAKDKNDVTYAQKKMADVFWRKGKAREDVSLQCFETALFWYQKANDVIEAAETRKAIAVEYANKGLQHAKNKEWKQAKECLLESIRRHQEEKNEVGIQRSRNYIAFVFQDEGLHHAANEHWSDAKNCLQEAIKLFNDLKLISSIDIAQGHLHEVLTKEKKVDAYVVYVKGQKQLKNKNWREARECFEEAIRRVQEEKCEDLIAIVRKNIHMVNSQEENAYLKKVGGLLKGLSMWETFEVKKAEGNQDAQKIWDMRRGLIVAPRR